MSDIIELFVHIFPTSRREWAWWVVVLGVAGAIMSIFTSPPAAAVAFATGAVSAALMGIAALLDRENGLWWAFLGTVLLAGGVGAFALLR